MERKRTVLTFEFIPIIDDGEPGVSQLSSGHIIVTGDRGQCSSYDGWPIWALIVNVDDLLYGVHRLLTGNADKQYVFEVIKGGYRLKFFKLKTGIVRLSGGGRDHIIAETTHKELIRAVWNGICPLYALYASTFEAVVPAQGDMAHVEESGLAELENILNQWQSSFPELPLYRERR